MTVDEYKAILAKQGPVDLKVVLSGCSSLDPNQVVVKGKTGESEQALLKRAQAIAGQASCSTQGLKVEREPREGIIMDGWCGKMNSRGGNHPVVCVDQKEAEAFCASEGATLPPEALYENATKGPSGTDEYGNPIAAATVYENLERRLKPGEELGTQPVCGENNETEGPFGVCDLAGNVWERTSTLYVSYNSPAWSSGTTNPNPSLEKNADGSYKRGQTVVFRGGSFNGNARYARAANRSDDYPSYRYNYVGFRCARWWPQDSK